MNVGMDIRLRRTRLNMKQKELARKAQVHPPRMCEYETGYTVIPQDVLERVLAVLSEAEMELKEEVGA